MFKVDGIEFEPNDIKDKFTVRSIPRPYEVEFCNGDIAAKIEHTISRETHPVVFIDEVMLSLYDIRLNCHVISMDAIESNKNIESVLSLMNEMQKNKITKASRIFVIGGGVTQDVGAFACGVYKRGIPWTYIPTTLLAQADSCIGGKSGLNHNGTKNLVAMFSAPSHVIIFPEFITTQSHADVLSGLGEIFRLCLTGNLLDEFEKVYLFAEQGNILALEELMKMALSVKQSIIEYDEFDTHIRISMNVGHSIGHAIEAITEYSIPHGIAVTAGIIIENIMCGLNNPDLIRLVKIASVIIPPQIFTEICSMPLDRMLETLMRDKKTQGNLLKIAAVGGIGDIQFRDFTLNDVKPIEAALKTMRIIYDSVA